MAGKVVGKVVYDEFGQPIIKKGVDFVLDKLDDMGIITAAKHQKNLGKSADEQTLNALTLKNLRDQKIAEAIEAKPEIKKEVDEIDIFADDIVQTPTPETNFTMDQVPESLKVINDLGEVEIVVGRKSYPANEVIMNIGQSGQKYFTLKQRSPYRAGDFINLGVKLADNQNIKNIMDDYIGGIINKQEAGRALSTIKGMPNFVQGQGQLYKATKKFDPFLEGYISTLKDPPEAIAFSNFLKKTKDPKLQTNRSVGFDKINQTIKIMKTLENDAFNKIKFPDGTTMKDQPLNTRMYNAYVLGEGPTSEPSQYSKYIKDYIKPFYKFKNPDAEVIPDFKKNWKSATTESGLIYDIRKGERNYQIPDEYKPYFNEVKEKIHEFIPHGKRSTVTSTFQNQLARMIGYAKEEGTDPDEIIRVIQGIDGEAFADLFMRKRALEDNIKFLREQSMSSSLKRTNPELFVDQNKKVGDFDIGLIELSHIEDVAQNWRAAFDINNIFLAPGKFNRDQLIIDKAIGKQLRAFSKATTFSQKKDIIKELKKIEQKLIDKNLISKHGDRYFGVSKDSVIEANLLKKVEEAVDYTRYLADGGFASIEEVLEY